MLVPGSSITRSSDCPCWGSSSSGRLCKPEEVQVGCEEARIHTSTTVVQMLEMMLRICSSWIQHLQIRVTVSKDSEGQWLETTVHLQHLPCGNSGLISLESIHVRLQGSEPVSRKGTLLGKVPLVGGACHVPSSAHAGVEEGPLFFL